MSNEGQIDYWNSEAGHNWVRNADQLDRLLQPFVAALLDKAGLNPGERVLDVGCGAGALTLEAARIVGAQRGAVGVDVSAPLLELARRRAAASGQAATYILEDASVYRAERPLDAAISRFGLMFFDDPAGAFTSLRRNLRPEGRLTFVCWAPLKENPWARFALEAVQSLLSEAPVPPPPGTPGPFAFADPDRVRSILREAGWRGVQVESFRPGLVLPGETLPETAAFLMEMGPAARVLREQALDGNVVQTAICERLADVPIIDGHRRMASSTWIVTATAS